MHLETSEKMDELLATCPGTGEGRRRAFPFLGAAVVSAVIGLSVDHNCKSIAFPHPSRESLNGQLEASTLRALLSPHLFSFLILACLNLRAPTKPTPPLVNAGPGVADQGFSSESKSKNRLFMVSLHLRPHAPLKESPPAQGHAIQTLDPQSGRLCLTDDRQGPGGGKKSNQNGG